MSSLKGTSVLITGANGFLGSVIRGELEKLEARTISIIWPPSEEYKHKADTIALDLLSSAGWEKLDGFGRIDAVIHCAAYR
jgi:nucleoside-diphosphate-sugar epimerase